MTHICLNLLTKNSGAVLRRSLESVLPYIQSYVIVDTDSTDNTLAIVKDVLGHLPGEVHNAAFDGFGPLRQANLDLTRGFLCQVNDAYVLWLDSGRQVTGSLRPDLNVDGYFANVTVNGGAYEFQRVHLIRARALWAWKYRAHETLVGANASDLCGLEIHEWREGPVDREKYIWAARMSEQDMLDHPGDPRVMFYCAQNWYDAGEFRIALGRYELRASMAGWFDEVWYSTMRAGLCWEQLGEVAAAAQCYKEAFDLAPYRAEPARHLARMLQSDYWTAIADAIPCPGSGLFVERAAYAQH